MVFRSNSKREKTHPGPGRLTSPPFASHRAGRCLFWFMPSTILDHRVAPCMCLTLPHSSPASCAHRPLSSESRAKHSWSEDSFERLAFLRHCDSASTSSIRDREVAQAEGERQVTRKGSPDHARRDVCDDPCVQAASRRWQRTQRRVLGL